MSPAELDALAEKLRAVNRSPEAREARRSEAMRRQDESLATQDMPPDMPLAQRKRLDVGVRRKAEQQEANRPTIGKYAEYLRLHAKDESRTKAETVQYNALGKRHRWHGRPEHVVHRRDLRPAPTLCLLRRDRAPRSRRVRTSRTSHGPPGRSTEGSDDDPHDHFEPPPWRLYEHSARVADRRVAAWLERWADELLEDVA
jgi:hypothetical protein